MGHFSAPATSGGMKGSSSQCLVDDVRDHTLLPFLYPKEPQIERPVWPSGA
jgi:hypothetical protein